jgi:hypothetical protein
VAAKSAKGPKNCSLKRRLMTEAVRQRRLASLKNSAPLGPGGARINIAKTIS